MVGLFFKLYWPSVTLGIDFFYPRFSDVDWKGLASFD